MDNPRYVRWIATLNIEDSVEGTIKKEILELRKCTDEDYAGFYPIQEEEAAGYEKYRYEENYGFLCIDWPDESKKMLYGDKDS